jgi:spore maturation protein CgeB
VSNQTPSLLARVRWKLRWPMDANNENQRLISAADKERPDVIFVDNSRLITRKTLREVRRLCNPILVYYSPDDLVARHNLSWPVRFTFAEWDVVLTTKTFNVPELKQRGVRDPILVGNAFDPNLHRPMNREEVGSEYEQFDLVFMGTFEKERRKSLNHLAEAGFRIVVYSGNLNEWNPRTMNRSIVMRPAKYGLRYCEGMHHGKIALCFLRKINRDRITTRSIECAAMGRPMLAEKTEEHDAHLIDGLEYLSFLDDAELIEKARYLCSHDANRRSVGARARIRCLESGYSTDDRAQDMIRAIMKHIEAD